MNREKIARVLFMSAILLVATALVIVFCVVPGGATAEEVIKDSYTIKTTAQWMLIVAGAFGVVCYKMHSEEQ